MSQTETAETATEARTAQRGGDERIAWVDYAKGICILLVCMMHSTLGTGEAMHGEGFMHTVVAWARPFRMPDFFLLSGLFVASVIDRPWRTYLDRKVLHFAYFYLLWLVIQSVFRLGPTFVSQPLAAANHFAWAAVYPFPPLWFIYVLPLYFVATKLTRGVPLWGMLGIAALLHTVPIHSGWPAIDVFAVHYFVYFLAGYAAAPWVFKFAAAAARHWQVALLCLPVWAAINGLYAFTPSRIGGYVMLADLPVVSIVIGLVGALAVVTTAALLARFRLATFIRFCGANSIVIYVCFMLPMALTRTVLIKTGVISNIGIASLLVITAAVLVPLALHMAVKGTPFRFLFERPRWFSVVPEARKKNVPEAWPQRQHRKPSAPKSRNLFRPLKEIIAMARRGSIPSKAYQPAERGAQVRATLKAANQNVPFNSLLDKAGNRNQDEAAEVRFELASARHSIRLDQFMARLTRFMGQMKDAVTGKPEIVEPAVMVDLRPDRLAKAIRARQPT